MATRLEIKVLQSVTFNHTQASLGKEESRVANAEFIAGLFKDNVPNKRLQRYMIRHCAFSLKAGELADDRFRTVVVLQMGHTGKLVSPHDLEASRVVLICFSDVWTPPGKTILLNTKSSNTIYEVKCMIADKEDNTFALRAPLENARTLETYNIKRTPPFFCLNRQEVVSHATNPMESLPILLQSEHYATRISDYQC